MNSVFRNALIINVTLLVVFILLDFLTWNAVAVNLNSRMLKILAPAPNPMYTPNLMGIYVNYGLFWVGINFRYTIPGIFLSPQDSVGISANLGLIWFIVTIAVNLYFIWYLETKRMIEPIKH